jgi:uncharacterized protein (DUF488 family)
MPPVLATIGYEQATLPDVIGRLQAAGVDTLIDVRAVAASRRAGFSKTVLSNSLAEAGIDYRHLRALGTPKAGRQAARAGRVAEMRDIFNAHLEEPEAQVQLAQAIGIVAGKRVALLCYEADASGCHRTIVADRIRDAIGCQIVNL